MLTNKVATVKTGYSPGRKTTTLPPLATQVQDAWIPLPSCNVKPCAFRRRQRGRAQCVALPRECGATLEPGSIAHWSYQTRALCVPCAQGLVPGCAWSALPLWGLGRRRQRSTQRAHQTPHSRIWPGPYWQMTCCKNVRSGREDKEFTRCVVKVLACDSEHSWVRPDHSLRVSSQRTLLCVRPYLCPFSFYQVG